MSRAAILAAYLSALIGPDRRSSVAVTTVSGIADLPMYPPDTDLLVSERVENPCGRLEHCEARADGSADKQMVDEAELGPQPSGERGDQPGDRELQEDGNHAAAVRAERDAQEQGADPH